MTMLCSSLGHVHGLGKHAMQDKVAMGKLVVAALRLFEP